MKSDVISYQEHYSDVYRGGYSMGDISDGGSPYKISGRYFEALRPEGSAQSPGMPGITVQFNKQSFTHT